MVDVLIQKGGIKFSVFLVLNGKLRFAISSNNVFQKPKLSKLANFL